MTPDNERSTERTRIGRRKYLAVSAAALAGVAGCASGDEPSGASVSTESDTTASNSDDSTATAARDDGTATPDRTAPEAATRSFYTTLYGDSDIEGANAMYHPESPAPGLEPANFEPFGGLENMGTEVRSTTVVSRENGRARVHAEVLYTTESGTMGRTLTDYVFLRMHDGEWTIYQWAPERIRRLQAKGTVREFYGTLYRDDDLDSANAMYHPDSDSGPLERADFERFGGLEDIGTAIQSARVVAEGGGTAEVHVEVEYTTPSGTSTMTDYVFLAVHRGAWRIDRWAPEATRESGGSDTT